MAESAMHDDGLSPTSKKILKECTVELPAAAAKDSCVSFVARPPSSGGQGAGFHFARPTLPRRAFTSHPQSRSSRATSEEDKAVSQGVDDEIALPQNTKLQDGLVTVVDVNPVSRAETKSPERARTASPSLERITPPKSALEIVQHPQDIPQPNLSKNTEGVVPINIQQATEDELFKLLIQKLKRREEAEIAASKLRDELKASLHTADENNKQLTARLSELERQYKEQQKEKTAQRQSVERWKFKFGKIRGLMAGIADHQERLLKEYQAIRKEQVSLNVEKDQMHDNLNYLTESSKGLGKNISRYKAQLTGIIHQFTAEEEALKSLLKSKESQFKDIEKLLAEKNQAVEEAKVLARNIECDKSTLEQNSREAEKRIREELSRASLMSKDQERARFEQERHILTREKQQAEADAAKGKGELETAKLALAENKSKNAELQATVVTYQQRIKDVEEECEAILIAHEQALSALKQQQTSQVGEKENMQQKLQALQDEYSILKQENSTLKLTNMAISGEHVALKQETAILQQTNTANQEENASLQQRLADTKVQMDVLEKENSDIRTEKAVQEKEVTELKASKATIEAEKTIAQAENTVLKQEISDAKVENAALKAENAVLSERYDRSASDKPGPTLDSAQPVTNPNSFNDACIKNEDASASSKGILKENQPTASPSSKRTTTHFQTPSRDKKKKRSTIISTAPRRQSRISSRFFDPQPTPSPSLSVITSQQGSTTWTVNQSVDTFMSQSSVHRRKRRREETFNNRFGHKYAFH
ncbi:hypothetical protein MGYG_07960 [Nannizzia gypsea CBS 118893]|uniref:Uncharacterized protein n=1 Tax=Arthroderma gypseum (strain ATCC MYA-4604 / CBS 118893) TaxID=535722 RepID=E4V4N4_ARTGP|nr:hypothetical protein MGYG_07960 [Nannizzia gypsea CBS 118893]EFR04958.1 hypothetical protein MGYG_07960 [Nannizzia gypsea CBS 118893]